MCRFLTLTLMCVCVLETIDRQKFTYRTREEPIINKDKHTHTCGYFFSDPLQTKRVTSEYLCCVMVDEKVNIYVFIGKFCDKMILILKQKLVLLNG